LLCIGMRNMRIDVANEEIIDLRSRDTEAHQSVERACWPPRRRPYGLRLRGGSGDPAWREPPDEKGAQGPDGHDLDSSPSFIASIYGVSAASGRRRLDLLISVAASPRLSDWAFGLNRDFSSVCINFGF
jgi:hypothetical protein